MSPAQGREGPARRASFHLDLPGAWRISCSLPTSLLSETLSTWPGSLCCTVSLHSCLKPGQHLDAWPLPASAACPVRKPRCKHSSRGPALQHPHPHVEPEAPFALPCMYTSASRQTESSIDRAARRPSRKHAPHVAAGPGSTYADPGRCALLDHLQHLGRCRPGCGANNGLCK